MALKSLDFNAAKQIQYQELYVGNVSIFRFVGALQLLDDLNKCSKEEKANAESCLFHLSNRAEILHNYAQKKSLSCQQSPV